MLRSRITFEAAVPQFSVRNGESFMKNKASQVFFPVLLCNFEYLAKIQQNDKTCVMGKNSSTFMYNVY